MSACGQDQVITDSLMRHTMGLDGPYHVDEGGGVPCHYYLLHSRGQESGHQQVAKPDYHRFADMVTRWDLTMAAFPLWNQKSGWHVSSGMHFTLGHESGHQHVLKPGYPRFANMSHKDTTNSTCLTDM